MVNYEAVCWCCGSTYVEAHGDVEIVGGQVVQLNDPLLLCPYCGCEVKLDAPRGLEEPHELYFEELRKAYLLAEAKTVAFKDGKWRTPHGFLNHVLDILAEEFGGPDTLKLLKTFSGHGRKEVRQMAAYALSLYKSARRSQQRKKTKEANARRAL